jgi:hypothetical protein
MIARDNHEVLPREAAGSGDAEFQGGGIAFGDLPAAAPEVIGAFLIAGGMSGASHRSRLGACIRSWNVQYAEPFASHGRFRNLRKVVAPRAGGL